MNDLSKIPYASWLEEVLQNVVDMPVESIYFIAKLENGATMPTCYNCTVNDKLLFSGIIQQDAMMDTLKNNGLVKDEDE